jgi:hypothetical protein
MPKQPEARKTDQPLALSSSAVLGPAAPAEDALRRAYYYTEAGEWRGPDAEEWERWHAVAKVAARPPLSEGALMGVYMDFDRRADKTWPPAEYLLRFAAAVQTAVLAGPNVGIEPPRSGRLE